MAITIISISTIFLIVAVVVSTNHELPTFHYAF